MNTQTRRNQGTLADMTDEIARGADIKRRREALHISNLRQFSLATGRDRDTLARAEEGKASATTMDWLEQWLDRREAGGMPPEPNGNGNGNGNTVKLTLHGVYGIDEIIVEGPVDQPDALAEQVGKILDRLKQRDE